MNPAEAPDKKSGAQNHARLYGTEYQSHYVGIRNNDHDAACAVCAYKGSATYYAWGTTECGSGHKQLYKGNVLGEHKGHSHRKEFVCVDQAQKTHAKQSTGNQDGVLWYQVEFQCGALPCGPFQENKEVACAVCDVEKG